jgi:hypothetical protein
MCSESDVVFVFLDLFPVEAGDLFQVLQFFEAAVFVAIGDDGFGLFGEQLQSVSEAN